MSVHGYTKNYKLIKPQFDTDTWHDHEYDNLDTIDAVLSAIYASGDWQGFWKNNTSYKAGSVVIDRNTDTMYKVVTEHTTDGNVTFAEYMFNHPEYYQLWSPNNLAQDWAIKDDGLADNQDYSAKAYAVGGVGTETNNAKYYSEQAGIQAEASAEQAAASASSATASYNSEQLALSHANQAAASASASQYGAEQSAASATHSQEQAELSQSHAEYAAGEVAGLESFVQEKQNEINASLAEAIKASEDAKKYAAEASGANIGDIFYTSRLDNELNGAVEANGAVYRVEAFTGEKSVHELLKAGKLPYVSFEEFAELVETNGVCRAFGYDGGYSFRVPKLNDVYLMAGQAENAGEFISESLPNISGTGIFTTSEDASGAIFDSGSEVQYQTGSAGTLYQAKNGSLDASRSSSAYQNGAKVRPDSVRYRAMVQLTAGVREDATQLKEYKFNNPHFFGQSVYSDVEPNNASFLISNGSFNSGKTYEGYYKWLTDRIGQTITANGGKVVLSTDAITDYDWVVDTTNETFRLPLLNGEEDLQGSLSETVTKTSPFTAQKNGRIFLTATSTALGQYVYLSNNVSAETNWSSSGSQLMQISLDVKKGDTITYATTTPSIGTISFVPAVGNGSLYFYVGDTLQDPALINAGAVLSDVADSIKRSSVVDRETVVGWGVPDYSAGITITSGYTADRKGLATVSMDGSNHVTSSVYINGIKIGHSSAGNQYQEASVNAQIPLDVGDEISWTGTQSVIAIFFPYKGV